MSEPAPERILVVDDEEAVRELIVEVLSDDGHEVTTAEDAETALELFKKVEYSLVISDIRMPGMNGITLLETLRGINQRTPVIIITSHASIDTALSALKAGAYDYLLKPFDDLDLVSTAVDRAIEHYDLMRERDRLIASLTKSNLELAGLNKMFRELAIRDGLTGVYNHRYCNEALAKEVERARRYDRALSLIFVDVDEFKQFNDSHGHQRGDQLLKVLAEVLQERVRDSDTVARWGGEEFVIIAPETESEAAAELAEDLRMAVAHHNFGPGASVTISLGVASAAANATSGGLVYSADQAVYAAKASGRNMVCVGCFDDEQDEARRA